MKQQNKFSPISIKQQNKLSPISNKANPRRVSDLKSLDFFPPACRVALLEVLYFALIVLGAANLAFAIDEISQTFEHYMFSLAECSLANPNKALQGGVNPLQPRSKHSFSLQGEDMVEFLANHRFHSCYFLFTGVLLKAHS